MYPSPFKRRPLSGALSGILVSGLFLQSAQATTRIWDGSALNSNWGFVDYSNSPNFLDTNWNLPASFPISGDSLQFQGSNDLTPYNDISGLSIAGITFAAGSGAYILNGKAITSTGNIVNKSAKMQTLNLPVAIGADQTWDGGSAGIGVNSNQDLTIASRRLTLSNGVDYLFETEYGYNHAVNVGGDTAAKLVIETGSRISGGDGHVGGTGHVSVTGAGSEWNNKSYLDTLGEINVSNGGKMTSRHADLHHSNALTVTGPQSLWQNEDDILLGGSLDIVGGGKVLSKSLQVGWTDGSNGDIRVSGNGSLLETTGADDFVLGYDGNGSLSIADGGKVVNNYAIVGQAGNQGTVSIAGTGSSWQVNEQLYLNRGEVNIGARGTLNARGAWIKDGGVLNLDGGVLRTGGLMLEDGAQFNWYRGIVNLLGDHHLGQANNKPFAALHANQTLDVDGTLTVSDVAPLYLKGGTVRAGVLAVDNGMVIADSNSSLYMTGIGTLSGKGSVLAAISGGTADNIIRAEGGTLNVGNYLSADGFDYGGKLDVGGNRIILLDQDQAQLGVQTSIADGGRLDAANGIALGNGETLNFSGNALIAGDFSNNGSVVGSGLLTFIDDVKGAGSFSGDIQFLADHKPGNSPATLDFHNGNVSYGEGSVLTMEIFGSTPGSEYDQLANIGHLDFNGTLALVFRLEGLPVAASVWQLFGFESFGGHLDASRISVAGLDRSLLDFSKIASHGSIGVAAVPLPASAWLMLSSLMGLLLMQRRPRNN